MQIDIFLMRATNLAINSRIVGVPFQNETAFSFKYAWQSHLWAAGAVPSKRGPKPVQPRGQQRVFKHVELGEQCSTMFARGERTWAKSLCPLLKLMSSTVDTPLCETFFFFNMIWIWNAWCLTTRGLLWTPKSNKWLSVLVSVWAEHFLRRRG